LQLRVSGVSVRISRSRSRSSSRISRSCSRIIIISRININRISGISMSMGAVGAAAVGVRGGSTSRTRNSSSTQPTQYTVHHTQ
jgi:hypothetical protein